MMERDKAVKLFDLLNQAGDPYSGIPEARVQEFLGALHSTHQQNIIRFVVRIIEQYAVDYCDDGDLRNAEGRKVCKRLRTFLSDIDYCGLPYI